MDYVELRGHTEFSLRYAMGRSKDVIERAKVIGMSAICLTERDSMRGIHDLYKLSKENDIRPIYGIEMPVVDDHRVRGLAEDESMSDKARDRKKAITREERRRGIDRSPSVCFRAMTDEGLINLYGLSSKGWLDGSYRGRPRVDFSLIEQYAVGVSASIGGADGIFGERMLRGEMSRAIGAVSRLQEIFGDNLTLELHPHPGDLNKKVNAATVMIAKSLDIKLIAANDIRYPTPDDQDAHTVVLCLRGHNSRTFADEDHPRSQPGYHLRTGQEVFDAFRINHPDLDQSLVKAAIERTLQVAETCQGKMQINPLRGLLPKLDIDGTPAEALRRLCVKGWEWREINKRAKARGASPEDYKKRLIHELNEIGTRGIETYFLFVRDVLGWARDQGILIGPGRGSAVGSLICYLIGITALDPLEHGLMFERFIAPGRVDMPDVDTDIQKSRREDVIKYIREKYGMEETAFIATHGRMNGKSAVKDICKVVGIPFGIANALTATFSTRQGDESQPAAEVLAGSEVGRQFVKDYPDAMELISKLEGTIRQLGIHAAGIVVAPGPLLEFSPMEFHCRKGEKQPTAVTAVDMNGVTDLGLLKLDALGLRNMDVVADIRSSVLERDGELIDFERLLFDDKKVVDGFTHQRFTGIFQKDSQSARNVCKDLVFAGFNDIAALIALNRPGCTRSGLTETYRRRRQDPTKIESIHPLYDEITKSTLGVLVYQEQVVRLFRDLAGFTPEEADKMRKIIGKKLGADEVEKYRAQFVAGAKQNGLSESDADLIYDSMRSFASYAFNISHATGYAAIAYWEMWAKIYHPMEFIRATLKNAEHVEDSLRYVNEARQLGIPVLPPDINVSGHSWTIGDHGVHAGLVDVKGVGAKAVDEIVRAQPFKSFSDFRRRLAPRVVNAKVVGQLVRAGAMRSLIPNTRWFLENSDKWGKLSKAGLYDELDSVIERSKDLPDYDEEQILALAQAVSPHTTGKHGTELYEELFKGDGIYAHSNWLDLSDKHFWLNKSGNIYGVVTEIKFRRVGDFDSEQKKTEAERKLMGWGRQYATMILEDRNGSQRRVKVEPDAFDRCRLALEKAKGQAVAAHVTILGSHNSIRAHYVVDLELVRQKLEINAPLSPLESTFTDKNPILVYSKKSFRKMSAHRATAIGMVTYVKQLVDKNDNEYAFFGLMDGYANSLDVVAFSDFYSAHADRLVVGRILKVDIEIDKRRGGAILVGDGIVEDFGSGVI